METRAGVDIQKEGGKRIPKKDGDGEFVKMAYSSKSF